jgi:uncharacterized protein (DUF433 family)
MVKTLEANRRNRASALLDTASYGLSEAAGYLFVPATTLRAWFLGQDYETSSGRRRFAPPLRISQRTPPLLSFVNLVEAHVLEAIRHQHGVTLQNVRKALAFLQRHVRSKHPLAEHGFETDGLDLFTEHYGRLINVSREGQVMMRDVVSAYLRRIERDARGVPIRLYPYTRHREREEPMSVVIDPRVSFGRPVLVGTGIPTEIIAQRYKAGESVDELADDYGRKRPEIEEAIRYELQIQPSRAA